MIVAAANWLISDGSVSRPPRAEAITAFLQGVGRAAARAGLRLDGRYEPVPEVALVLAGDTFDRLASRRWLGRVKPWHRGRTVREIADGVDLGILRNGRRLLRQLARLSIRGIEVPSADHRGRPDLRSPVRVPVRLVLLEGDRDRGISAALLPAESRWNGLLRSDREHGRLSFGSRFLAGHASASGDTPRIEIRHGHEFDPCCQPPESSGAALAEDRSLAGRPTLGESIHVDLVARFAWGLSAPSAGRAPRLPEPRRRSLVRMLSACGPLDLPARLGAWLAVPADAPPIGRGASPAFDTRLATVVRDAWRRSVDHWRQAARIEDVGCLPGVDVVDTLWDRLHRLEPAPGAVGQEGWLRIDCDGLLAACRAMAPRGNAAPAKPSAAAAIRTAVLAASAGVRAASPTTAPGWLVLGHPPAGLPGAEDASVILLGGSPPLYARAAVRSRKAWGAVEVEPFRSEETDFHWVAIDPGPSGAEAGLGTAEPGRRAA
jgi:hypothetical protein